MYRVCIFDLDGTLADTVDSMAYSANLALKDMGLQALLAERFKNFAGDGADELIRRCLRASGDEQCIRFKEMNVLYRNYFSKNCMYHVKPYDGILNLLKEMKQAGIKIAVLSNKPHDQAIDVVESIFGAGFFDFIQGQRDGIPRKPDPSGALAIAEHFQVSSQECLYVGDTNTDMQTGNAAGMNTVGVLWGFRTRQELEENKAGWIAAAPDDILKLIKEQLA